MDLFTFLVFLSSFLRVSFSSVSITFNLELPRYRITLQGARFQEVLEILGESHYESWRGTEATRGKHTTVMKRKSSNQFVPRVRLLLGSWSVTTVDDRIVQLCRVVYPWYLSGINDTSVFHRIIFTVSTVRKKEAELEIMINFGSHSNALSNFTFGTSHVDVASSRRARYTMLEGLGGGTGRMGKNLISKSPKINCARRLIVLWPCASKRCRGPVASIYTGM